MLTGPQLHRWLKDIRQGRRTSGALVRELRRPPFEDLGFARLDTHRRLRRGLPEIIFGQGKDPDQLIAIVRRLAAAHEPVLLTRLPPSAFEQINRALPRLRLRYHAMARLAYQPLASRRSLKGLVLVVTGGTADLPIAEEAALTLTFLGSRAMRLYDVGVAGVHRLLAHWRLLQRSRAIVVIAGMDGALPSVVGGLVACPVIAVPTSIGYGAHFQGLAPLLTMLNSCVPGVGVVNIDNGFGAAYLAHIINHPQR